MSRTRVSPAQEYDLRPKVIETLKRNLELAQSVVRAWPDTKPWIPEADREDVAKKVRACACVCVCALATARVGRVCKLPHQELGAA